MVVHYAQCAIHMLHIVVRLNRFTNKLSASGVILMHGRGENGK